MVPVPPLVGVGSWHDDDVSFAHADLVVAAGAAVLLRGLVGLDATHVDVVVDPAHVPTTAHTTSATITANAAATMRRSPRCCTRCRNGL